MAIQHREGFFEGTGGLRLYEQYWLPETPAEAKGVVVIVHGLAEHSGRYAHVGQFLAQHGYIAPALDHRGHGQSGGGHTTYVDRYTDWLADLDLFLARVRAEFSGKPLFLLGHSLGGLISTAYVLTYKPELRGVLLSGAALKIGADVSPLMVKLAGFLGTVAPNMPTIKLSNSSVSRDPAVMQRYDDDPLNYRGGIPARTGAELNRAVQFVQAHFTEFNLPVRIMYGTEDILADPKGSQMLYEQAASTDKTLRPYQGLYHEIMNEPEKEMVLGEIAEWLDTRV
jgi:alpha-beta hydrolase superfamily lysophospholipase